MTVVDRKQMIKNYVDNANEGFISMVEGIIASFEDDKSNIQAFTPEQQKKYNRAISELGAGESMLHD